MKPFSQHLARERYLSDCRSRSAQKRRADRQRTREERRERSKRRTAILSGVLLLLFAAIAWVLSSAPSARAEAQPKETACPQQAPTIPEPTKPTEPEDVEHKTMEDPPVDSGSFRKDVPLDAGTQALLRSACEESGIPYALALAVIDQETDFRNITGDGGNSIGYMQIQPRWHQLRMERLGVEDLQDPYSNFRVGCDYLAELLAQYSLAEALTAYNTGRPGQSAYADEVLQRMEAYS